MNHLIINRDYPPCPHGSGGIGTYVDHISRLLAHHGETVHVIGQLWPGAPRAREHLMDGRLIVHRVSWDEPLHEGTADSALLNAFRDSVLPVQTFMWQAARLAESLVETAAIEIIEAQEYEAPLYFLLLRRALGLTTGRCVPVIVHLHTGTEFVFRQNEWNQERPDYLPAKRLEDYTIRAADGLLCPSRFLARIAERHYRLEPGSIEVMPYPIGGSSVLPRDASVWAKGTICYVGRLEPRKGVTEWIEAAVAVAASDPDTQFTLIGEDTPYSGSGDCSTRDVLEARIPPALHGRFTFLDFLPRPQLAAHLARARLAVVPSRWENFPNTCIEAMSSGLPVIVSPTGGMAEMVEDGRTGWIAEGPDPRSLETALRRALSTPPQILAQMGSAAAASIRVLCDNEQTVRRHIEFKRRLVARGCHRSSQIVAPSISGTRTRHGGASRSSSAAVSKGIAIIVKSRSPAAATRCIESIVSQTVPPVSVVLAVPPGTRIPVPYPPDGARCPWHIVEHANVESRAASDAALHIATAGSNPLAVAFVDDEWVLAGDYVAAIDRVFRHSSSVGIVTPWYQEDGRMNTGLPPMFPYQWAWNDVGPCAAFRMTAIEEVGPMRTGLDGDDALWGLANAILSTGWAGTPFPTMLASRQGSVLRTRTHTVGIRKAPLAGGRVMTPLEVLQSTPRQRRDLVRRAMANPVYVVRWLAWHGRGTVSRVSRRLLAAGRAALRRRAS